MNLLEEQFSKIKNYHVAIDYKGTDLIFLHKVIEGGTDESYGIEVAQLAGFPLKVIDRARGLRSKIAQAKLTNGLPPIIKDSQANEAMKRSSEAFVPLVIQDGPKVSDEDLHKTISKTSNKPRSLMTFVSLKEYEAIVSELKNFDIAKNTPLDALVKIQEWQKKLKELT